MECEYTEKELCDSIRQNNTDKAIYLITKGITLVSCVFRVFHLAAAHDNIKIMKTLLEMGADINVKDINGCTPLHISIHFQNVDSFIFLIERGADITIKDKTGMTPLLYAARINDIGMVRYLISKGSNIEEYDYSNRKIIHYAISKHKHAHKDVQRISYKEYGNDGNIIDNNGGNNNEDNNEDINGDNHIIVKKNKDEDIKILIIDEYLKRGGDINAIVETYTYRTPLWWACRKGYIKIVDFLIKKEALKYFNKERRIKIIIDNIESNIESNLDEYNLDREYIFGEYLSKLITVAITWNRIELIKHFVENITHINNKNYIKQIKDIIIFGAVQKDKLEILKFLITIGADVNNIDDMGDTPLHHTKNLECAKLLVQNGADIDAAGFQNMTVLSKAIYSGREEMAIYLIERGANINTKMCDYTPLVSSIFKCNYSLIQLLLEKGADVHYYMNVTYAPIHRAAFSLDKNIIKLILRYGADINIIDINGNTILHRIIMYVHTYMSDAYHNIIVLLIKNGIDIWKRNNDDMTALDITRHNIKHKMVDILKNYPRIIPLVGMCIRVARRNKIDTLWLPHIMFKFPNLL